MALYFKIEGGKIVFYGDTFNHRPAIKELGARFNGENKTWTLNDSPEMRDRASTIASLAVGTSTKSVSQSSSNKTITSARDLPVVNEELDPALGLTVSQLVSLADRAISQAFPTPIWVIGEIQSYTKRAGGTIYFDFAEGKTGAHQTATVTVKCNIWQNTVQWLVKRHGKEKFESVLIDGNRLRALVQVKLYKDRGQLSLTIEDIDPSFTQGALALARAELLKKLRQQGLDQKNKLLPMPAFPFRVALITAEGSRAHSDFEHQLTSTGIFCGDLIFIPCAMQGDNVPKNVVWAIKKAQDATVDVIVICRGGGSAADLRWFDGEEIAIAIANAGIPVIAAIGHHDDTCVAEDIAHLREKTPTAAADRILGIFTDTRAAINEKAHTLAVILDREMTRFDRQQLALKERLGTALEQLFSEHQRSLLLRTIDLQRNFETLAGRQESSYISIAAQINHAANQALQKLSDSLFGLNQRLTQLDPKPWLKEGWTQLVVGGKKLISIHDGQIGDTLNARVIDGTLTLKITDKMTKTKGGKDGKT
jgi:exodeoxyribonuclease VII large subunit